MLEGRWLFLLWDAEEKNQARILCRDILWPVNNMGTTQTRVVVVVVVVGGDPACACRYIKLKSGKSLLAVSCSAG